MLISKVSSLSEFNSTLIAPSTSTPVINGARSTLAAETFLISSIVAGGVVICDSLFVESLEYRFLSSWGIFLANERIGVRM